MHSNVLLVTALLSAMHILACVWFGIGNFMDEGWYRTRENELAAQDSNQSSAPTVQDSDAQAAAEVVYNFAHRNGHLHEKYLLSVYQVRGPVGIEERARG